MKKIALITGSRADYGIMKHLIRKLYDDPEIDLKIIATAMHMEKKYGYTYKQIENDGFNIFKKITLNMTNSTDNQIIHEIADLSIALSEIYESEKFDLTLILGDRYEMLAAANTSVIYTVPICHLHGGEKTLGNYDEFIRNAITKMSHLHLTSTESYRKRVIQMGELPQWVVDTGSLGVENVLNEKQVTFEKLQQSVSLTNFQKKNYFVCLFHPTTLESPDENKKVISNLLQLMSKYNCVFIGSNSDTGSDTIMNDIKIDVKSNSRHVLFDSLSTESFHCLVRNSNGLVGNSSSGIIEVPSLKVPTLNIGNRQSGRERGNSVIDVDGLNEYTLRNALNSMNEIRNFSNPYYKKDSANIAYKAIKKFLSNFKNIEKDFFDIKFNI